MAFGRIVQLEDIMFVCLSSGASPRYREDIVRSLSMPPGMKLQFRYEEKYLTQPVLAAVVADQAEDEDALIVYIDQANLPVPPTYVPTRHARVTRVNRHGTTLSVELILGDFAY